MASYYYYGVGDFERARSELAIARRVLPNNPEIFQYTGFMDRRQGHWQDATRNLEQALELDPRNLFLLQQLALTYQPQRRYREEAQIWDRLLTIVPGDPLTRISRALIAFHSRADLKPYITTLTALISENPSAAPDVDSPVYAICERNALLQNVRSRITRSKVRLAMVLTFRTLTGKESSLAWRATPPKREPHLPLLEMPQRRPPTSSPIPPVL